MKTKKYQLKNGLTVLLTESRKSPIVSVQMWVRTGSADESPAQAGISHFIEHLVFKGTRKYGVGEIASFVEGAGGQLNAYTSFDQTVFYVTIASSKAEVALDTISQMMGYPTFDPVEVDKEREVVIEEIKMGQDSPSRRNSQLMFSTAYRKHPYGRPVIGFDRIIRKVSVNVLKKYYRERYCPRNMFLTVTGDFESQTMKAKVQSFFGDFEDNRLRKTKRMKEPSRSKPTIRVEKSDFKETYVSLAWRAPAVEHKDVPALDLLALIFGQGESSRLVQKLRIETAVVNSVGASAFTPQNPGLFTVNMTLDAEKIDQAMEILDTEINEICTTLPSAIEVEKAIVCLASEPIYSMETVDGIARSVGGMEFHFRDPNYFATYLKQLKAVRPEDILKVARKYLKRQEMSATALTDADQKRIEHSLRRFTRRAMPSRSAQKAVKYSSQGLGLRWSAKISGKTPATEKIRTKNGALLILREDRETPTTSLRLAYGGGLLVEPQGKDGLIELLTRTWAAGTAQLTEKEIGEKVDSMAASFGSFGGRNTLGLSAEFISSFEDPMWDIFQGVLTNPSWPSEVFQREKQILQSQVKVRRDNPAQLCVRAFMEALFPKHPYSKDMLGTNESLETIKIEDVQELQRKIFTQGNLAICMTGDFSSSKWRKRLEEVVSSLEAGGSLLKAPTHAPPNQEIRRYQNLQKEQSHLIVGFRGLDLTDRRRWALQLMQAVLAGQGGRLFVELRDKKSLAYTVSPLRMEGMGTGYFGAYIACSPEKAAQAEAMMREQLHRVANDLIPEAELDRARQFMVGRTVIDLQRKSAICNSLLFDEIYNLNSEDSLHPERIFNQVTSEEIRDLAKDIFSKPSVTSLVGPREDHLV